MLPCGATTVSGGEAGTAAEPYVLGSQPDAALTALAVSAVTISSFAGRLNMVLPGTRRMVRFRAWQIARLPGPSH